ncbi:MAG: flavodoxin family protein [Methanoregulaceae archaeon]|nr:flavodoxin family protein [Methanoregulaceae archaeon]
MGCQIVALLGSPLKNGNTAKLLDRAVQGAKDAGCEVETIVVPFLDFEACMEMFFCVDHEICGMEDAMVQIYPKFRSLDGIIVATPVMTMGIPGKLKSFMDRFQVFYMAKYVRKQPLVPKELKAHRRGLYIGISGMKVPDVFEGSKRSMKTFFDIIDVSYGNELLINDMDNIRDIGTKPELLEEAYRKGLDLGKAVAGKE